MRFDHHLHTAKHSPDSIIDPWELIEHAREIGLDGVVITEHDYQWEADELAELAARAAPLRVFSGVELSTLEGHFLVYGLPSLEDVFPGIELAELLPRRGRAHEVAGLQVLRDVARLRRRNLLIFLGVRQRSEPPYLLIRDHPSAPTGRNLRWSH